MTLTERVRLRVHKQRHKHDGADGLTPGEQRRLARRYQMTAATEPTLAEMNALRAKMIARREERHDAASA